MKSSTGVHYGKHSRKYLRPHGGLSFLDRLNDALLTLTEDELSTAKYDRELTLSNGMTLQYLGSGVYRSSFRYGNLVVKFPKGIDASHDNVNEWEIYQEALRVGMAGSLAACIAMLDGWPFGVVTVYEYVPGKETWGGMSERKMSLRFSRKGANVRAHDLHGGNVRGRKVIDYGLFEFRSRREVDEAVDKVLPENKYVKRV